MTLALTCVLMCIEVYIDVVFMLSYFLRIALGPVGPCLVCVCFVGNFNDNSVPIINVRFGCI